jgi:tetratricopeptide (TPR) repeat protein
MIHANRMRILLMSCILACPALCLSSEDVWTEIRSPNFILFSNTNVKQSRRTARSFEQFRLLLQTALPRLKADTPSPLVVFACRDEKSFRSLLPNDRLQPRAVQPSGLFIAGPERSFVLLRVDLPGDQGFHVIYHEYVHMIMRLNFQTMPLWLSEGLAEFFGHANISDRASGLGNPSPEQIQVLRGSTMIPLPTLMSVTNDSPYYRQEEKSRIFYAESWALTHYLMLGDKRAHSKQLDQFLNLIRNGMPEQEAATTALGDLRILQSNLEQYVRSMAFYHYEYPARLNVTEEQYSARTLSENEFLASRGVLFVHTNRLDEARLLLDQALQMNPGSATANEGMGLLWLRLQEPSKAKKFFAKAADLDSSSFLSQFYAAQAAYEEDADYENTVGRLRKALQINPQFAPAYVMLSQLLMRQEATMPEALEAAKKAAELEPAEQTPHILVGQILINMRRYEEAGRLCDRLIAASRNEAERRQAESLLFSIKDHRDYEDRMDEARRKAELLREEAKQREDRLRETRGAENKPPPGDDLSGERPAEVPAKKAGSVAQVKAGPAAKSGGIIRSVACTYPAIMDVVLDSNGKQLRLRAQNYYEVRYWAVGASGKTGFEPCEELQGKRVNIQFLTVTGQEFSGLIQTVEIIPK